MKSPEKSKNGYSGLFNGKIRLLGPTFVPLIAPAIMIGIIIIAMLFINPSFFNFGNIRAVMLDMSIVLILAVGMTVVITSGGIDLSIGGILVFSSVMLSAVIKDFGLPTFIGVTAGLTVGALCGLVNGLLITKLKMPPFIVTLSSELVFRGLAFVYAGGAVFYSFPKFFQIVGRSRVIGIPMPFIISMSLAIIAHFIFTTHKLGLHIHAVGQNDRAARRMGIDPIMYRIGSYTFMGFLAGVAGIVMTGRLDAVVASGAVTILLNTIAAVIVGGTDLFGGKGSMLGTILGALLLAMVNNAVVMVGLASFWQHVAAGVVILITIALYSHRSEGIEG